MGVPRFYYLLRIFLEMLVENEGFYDLSSLC